MAFKSFTFTQHPVSIFLILSHSFPFFVCYRPLCVSFVTELIFCSLLQIEDIFARSEKLLKISWPAF